MRVPLISPPATPAAVSLATVDAALLARLLRQPSARLLIDCGAQPGLSYLGVCHFLSQLLLLRQRGASVWLCNADPLLRRCLKVVGLETTFPLAEQEAKLVADPGA